MIISKGAIYMNLEILSDLIITKVYSATTMYTEKNAKTQRNNRPNWAIVIKYEGETLYVSGGKSYLSDIHNLVILPLYKSFTMDS